MKYRTFPRVYAGSYIAKALSRCKFLSGVKKKKTKTLQLTVIWPTLYGSLNNTRTPLCISTPVTKVFTISMLLKGDIWDCMCSITDKEVWKSCYVSTFKWRNRPLLHKPEDSTEQRQRQPKIASPQTTTDGDPERKKWLWFLSTDGTKYRW